jgi:uncharacterized membrane protein YebE (DUF533 family)
MEELEGRAGVKKDISRKTTFGIPNSVLVIGSIILVSAIAYKVYSKYKKK